MDTAPGKMTDRSDPDGSTPLATRFGFSGPEAVGAGALLLFTAGLSLLLFPGRVHVPVLVILAWGVLCPLMLRLGHGWLTLGGVLLFWLLVYAELLSHDTTRSYHVAAHLALTTFLVAVGALAYRTARGFARHVVTAVLYIVTVVLASAALFYLWHLARFDVPVTQPVVYAILQTHSGELRDFVSGFADWRMFLWAVLVLLVPGFLLYRQHRAEAGRGDWRLLALLAVGLLAGVVYLRGQLRIFEMLATSTLDYRRELAAFRALRDSRVTGETMVHGEKDAAGETYVVVIGESLNRNHMQLYGYHRATTPVLDSLYRTGELLRFTEAYATHTHTARALPPALTAMNQRNGLALAEAPSLLEVADAAGFDTYWITNQVLYGNWDNLVSIIAHDADTIVRLNVNVGETTDTQKHDEAVVAVLRNVLQRPGEHNRLVVVHLMGSHWSYCDRYSGEFERYRGDTLARGEFGNPRAGYLASALNCYDSSVFYNDHVVGALLDVARAAGGVSALLYISDHSEDVLNGHGHHSELFTFQMVEIPFVVWLSEQYRERYADRVANLARNAHSIFPSDFLFDTALGIAGIRSVHQDSLADMSSATYRTDDIPLTMVEGRHHLRDASNSRFHQRVNIGVLRELGQVTRVIPHRVNSTGMLSEVLYDGYSSLELDLLFRQASGGGHFETGHDEESRSGNDLADVLTSLPPDASARLWLDIKNLNSSNAAALQAELLRLDGAFGLKARALVESPSVEQLAPLQRAGFHTSYYLPTERLVALLESGDADAMAAEAAAIGQRVREFGVAAVSFDQRLYPFVKRYLEPRLSSGTVYHTWNLNLSLGDPNFIEQLHAFDAYSDPRVQTILVKYESELIL